MDALTALEIYSSPHTIYHSKAQNHNHPQYVLAFQTGCNPPQRYETIDSASRPVQRSCETPPILSFPETSPYTHLRKMYLTQLVILTGIYTRYDSVLREKHVFLRLSDYLTCHVIWIF
jgi:hypothetical protein